MSMRARAITKEQAEAAYTILVEEAGANPDKYERYAFVHYVVEKHGDEYRFIGKLGFGGKFRNNGNHDDTPYIDCYPEHLTPARQTIIDNVNGKFVKLFTEG